MPDKIVRPVVRVIVHPEKIGRHGQEDNRSGQNRPRSPSAFRASSTFADFFLQDIQEARRADSDPQRKRPEGAHEYVIPLPRLRIRHIQIDRQSQSHNHKKRQEGQKPLRILPCVQDHPSESQCQGNNRNFHQHRGISRGRTKGRGPAHQSHLELLKEILEVHIPDLVPPEIRPSIQHAQQRAPLPVLLPLEEILETLPRCRIVQVDRRVQSRSDHQQIIRRISQ